MRARLVVFPIKGKKWCFSRSIDMSPSESSAANTPSTVTELFKKIASNSKPLSANAELLVNFVSNKMNNAWMGLEKAPEGSFKNKLQWFKCTACATKITSNSLEPPKELEDLINRGHGDGYLSGEAISDICNSFSLTCTQR